MNDLIAAREIDITGVVQGVGFRPFLFQLAHSYGLKGRVFNTFKGVTINVEGTLDNIDKFCLDIANKKPPLALIASIETNPVTLLHYKDFVISKSIDISAGTDSSQSTLISPDVSVCADCINEMQDPNDRRFGYPFINCTNCGPRYTIIKDIPYDRSKTSMDIFKMCGCCQKEYDDPFNRRFHAQPNACPVCGPHLLLVDSLCKDVTVTPPHNHSFKENIPPDSVQAEPLELAAELLKQGKILAIKGLGGFHIAVDAMNQNAVAELRRRKKRPHKPFALMAKSVDAVSELVFISSEERQILESHHRPIVLLAKKKGLLYDNVGNNDHCSLRYIAPNNNFLGIMLPYTPLHYLLLEKGPSILVMTSGNRSGEPISIDNQDALDAFADIADYFLIHNRDIYFRADDSIMQVQNHIPRFFRRSRGYAPLPINLPGSMVCCTANIATTDISVLGCGAGLKNTVCLTSGNMAFLSQHIGDLENEKVFEFYRASINHLKKIVDVEPKVIAHDLHPDYLSTKFANLLQFTHLLQVDSSNLLNSNSIQNSGNIPKLTLIAVQHHHAHAVSCMAENGIQGDVIAITLDGTGLGTDGNIWGGEILLCNETDFQRKAHLQYIPMPGGDAAAKEPWRMAVSYLYAAFGEDINGQRFGKVQEHRVAFIIGMLKRRINSPLTSSCGRLFDAVASLCSIRHEITFESQAAIELQAISTFMDKVDSDCYSFDVDEILDNNAIKDSKKMFVINMLPCIREIVQDINLVNKIMNKEISVEPDNSISIGRIGSKFHRTVIDGFVCAAKKVSLDTGIERVVLSGGVFNNLLILTGMTHSLEKEGFTVYSHSKVPSGDGGISLGQAVIAGMRLLRGEDGI